MINLLFFLIFFSNVLINVDHGTLPGCTKEMSNDLDLNKGQFGTLGSIVYAGLTLGAVFASPVFERANFIKPALFLSLVLDAVCVYLFGISDNFLYDAALRFAIGIF